MAFARDSYTATGTDPEDFTITFSYLEEAHVIVTVDGVTQTQDTDYSIVSGTTVRFSAATSVLSGGETVVLQRNTSQTSRIVDYASGANLPEEDLDNDSLQAFYMAQEAIDIANTAMVLGTNDLWDAQNTIIDNVGTPTSSDHAATKGYVDAISVAAGNVTSPDTDDVGKFLKATSTTTWDWSNTIEPDAVGTKGLIVKGLSGQTANLQEWQNNGGTALGWVTAGGNVVVDAGDLTVTAGDLTVTAGDATITAGGLTVTAGDITHRGLAVAKPNMIRNPLFVSWQQYPTTNAISSTVTSGDEVHWVDCWRTRWSFASGTYDGDSFRVANATTIGTLFDATGMYSAMRTRMIPSATASGDFALLTQRIPYLYKFSQKTYTVSFYAWSETSGQQLGYSVIENYGTTGSPSAETEPTYVTGDGTNRVIDLGTSPTRYSFTFTVNDVRTGKTYGTSSQNPSYLGIEFWQFHHALSDIRTGMGAVSAQATASDDDIYITGVKMEEGTSMTPFGEIKAPFEYRFECHPYIQVYHDPTGTEYTSLPLGFDMDYLDGGAAIGTGFAGSTADAWIFMQFAEPMAFDPTVTLDGTANAFTIWNTGASTGDADYNSQASTNSYGLAINFDNTSNTLTDGHGCLARVKSGNGGWVRAKCEV